MFNWAEDNIIRERVFVPADKQAELRAASRDAPGRAGLGNGPCPTRPDARCDEQGGDSPLAPYRRRDLDDAEIHRHRAHPGGDPGAAGPVSVVTFAIIQAPPGDYGDYIRSRMLMNQGGVSNADAEAQADAYREAHGLERPAAAPVFQLDHRHRHPLRFRPLASTTTSRSATSSPSACRAPSLLALTCHILASLIGITLGIVAATRQYSWVDTAASASSPSSA